MPNSSIWMTANYRVQEIFGSELLNHTLSKKDSEGEPSHKTNIFHKLILALLSRQTSDSIVTRSCVYSWQVTNFISFCIDHDFWLWHAVFLCILNVCATSATPSCNVIRPQPWLPCWPSWQRLLKFAMSQWLSQLQLGCKLPLFV